MNPDPWHDNYHHLMSTFLPRLRAETVRFCKSMDWDDECAKMVQEVFLLHRMALRRTVDRTTHRPEDVVSWHFEMVQVLCLWFAKHPSPQNEKPGFVTMLLLCLVTIMFHTDHEDDYGSATVMEIYEGGGMDPHIFNHAMISWAAEHGPKLHRVWTRVAHSNGSKNMRKELKSFGESFFSHPIIQ